MESVLLPYPITTCSNYQQAVATCLKMLYVVLSTMRARSSKTLSLSCQACSMNHLAVSYDVMGMMLRLYCWAKFIWDLP